jgi:Rieske Fe-S protein
MIPPDRLERRTLVRLMLGAGAVLCTGVPIAAQGDPRELPPQTGDRLVMAAGDRAGQRIAVADMKAGSPPIVAYPQDPGTGVTRDGSRLNQIAVLRLEAADLAPETRARSAEGIVAFSGVCTHTGCDVSDWDGEATELVCPCHLSHFDPRDAGRVKSGPAPRRLASLPLAIADGELAVAAAFIGRVGPSE